MLLVLGGAIELLVQLIPFPGYAQVAAATAFHRLAKTALGTDHGPVHIGDGSATAKHSRRRT